MQEEKVTNQEIETFVNGAFPEGLAYEVSATIADRLWGSVTTGITEYAAGMSEACTQIAASIRALPTPPESTSHDSEGVANA